MSTVIRPEVSKKNEWWIDRQRYYELKHFCLQYQGWCRIIRELDGLHSRSVADIIFAGVSDPTAKIAEVREKYLRNIEMIKRATDEADPVIGTYILRGVTEGLSYETLRMLTDVPCCKDVYYDLYRKFFWILDQLRE